MNTANKPNIAKPYLDMLAIHVQQQQMGLRDTLAQLMTGTLEYRVTEQLVKANQTYLEAIRLAQMEAIAATINAAADKVA